MKLIVSSYNQNIEALSLLYIDMSSKSYKILDQVKLYEPSFVTRNNEYIFTYTKNDLELLAFKIDNDKLILVDKISVALNTLTHLSFNSKNNTLYGASYLDGAMVKCEFINEKFNNLIIKKEGGKCHQIICNDTLDRVLVVNIEFDMLSIYDLDFNLIEVINLPPKTGPRHAYWNKDIIYVVTEYSNELFKIENCKLASRVKTIKEDVKSNCATLLVDDNYIYVSNRGEETIARIEYKDKLKLNSSLNVYGNHSRHMIFDETKNYIISFNKISNNISIIDKLTNELIMNIPYNNCSCGVVI